MHQHSNNKTTPDQQKDLAATSGTFVPSDYNKIITTTSGRPDSTAINLLAEIVYLHKPSKYGGDKKFSGNLLNLKYSDLETKFNKSHESIRRAFVKLELLGLIKRSYQKISFKTTTCSNMLFIEFNKERYNSLLYKEECLASKNIVEAKNFCGHLKNEDSYPQKCGDVYREKKENNKEAKSYGLSFFSFGFRGALPLASMSLDNSYLAISGIGLRNGFRLGKTALSLDQHPILPEKTEETPNKFKNLQENIQSENLNEVVISNFSASSATSYAAPDLPARSELRSFEDYKWRSPTEFLHLEPKFCDLIRSKTGKNFPDPYFENVVIKLFAEDRKQHGEKLKWRRVQLLSRLVAWANRELKDLDSILAECGLKSSEELKSAKSVEKLEATIVVRCENSKDISPIGTLKRKIAGSMDQKMAAFLLQNASFEICSFTEKVTTKILSWDSETKEFVDPESSKRQVLEKILTDIAKSLLGEEASAEIIYDFAKNGISGTLGLYGSFGSISPSQNQVTYSENKLYRNVQESLYKKFGDGLYKSWFSKLEFYRVKMDPDRKNIQEMLSDNLSESSCVYVTAPTIFMSDWVKNNYATAIEESFRQNSSGVLSIKCLTAEEFKKVLLDPESNNGSGLEIVDSSVTLQDPKNSEDSGGEDSGSEEYSEGEGGSYYTEECVDTICIAS